MILILLHDDTWYLLNVYVQSIGYYLQNIVQLGFHTGKRSVCRAMKDKGMDGSGYYAWVF